jgi:hypothetical protein
MLHVQVGRKDLVQQTKKVSAAAARFVFEGGRWMVEPVGKSTLLIYATHAKGAAGVSLSAHTNGYNGPVTKGGKPDGRTVAGKAWGRKRQEGGVTSQRAKNARTLLQPEPEPGSLRVELGCGSQIYLGKKLDQRKVTVLDFG